MATTPRPDDPSDEDLDVDALSGALTDAEYDDAHDIDAFRDVDGPAHTEPEPAEPENGVATPAAADAAQESMTSSSATISAAKADTTTTDEPATVTEPSSADTETGPDDGTNENATTAAEHDPAARTVTVSRRRRLLARAVIGILLVAAVIGGVLAGIWGTSLQDREQVADAAKAAEDTARTYAVTLTSIDSATIDQNFQQVLDGATGSFKDMYAKSSDQLKTLLVQNKATSKGQVIDSGVQSASRDRVVVLLFVDQSVTNNQSPDPRVDRSRITMTMNRVDGRWLASQVDLK